MKQRISLIFWIVVFIGIVILVIARPSSGDMSGALAELFTYIVGIFLIGLAAKYLYRYLRNRQRRIHTDQGDV